MNVSLIILSRARISEGEEAQRTVTNTLVKVAER